MAQDQAPGTAPGASGAESPASLREAATKAMGDHGWFVARVHDAHWVESSDWVPVLRAALSAGAESPDSGARDEDERPGERAYRERMALEKAEAAAAGATTMNGSQLIAIERQRQIDAEGYDAEHDRGHADELARAGAAYALGSPVGPSQSVSQFAPSIWPWNPIYWKPTRDDRIRELVKAGALIAAAIDSLADSPTPDPA